MILTRNIKNKLYSYFKVKLGAYNYSKGWLKLNCPSCGKHKYGIHLGLNRTNCFYCAYNPKPIDFLMTLESFDTVHQVHALLNDISGIEYVEPIIQPKSLKENTKLPDSYVNIRRGEGRFGKTARATLKNRGFKIKELSRQGWGYCTKGKYQGYIIMPFYVNGRLTYFNARRFLGDGPKFNNPDIEDFGLGKSMIIYNVDALYMHNKIFLVEGVMNSETIGNNSIATGGKKISNYQLNIIIKSPVKKVIIGLDDDAISDAIKVAFKLVEHKKVKIMEMPKGLDHNDLGRKKTRKIASQAKYLDHRGIMELKHKYNA